MRWLIVEDALRDRKGHWFEAVTTFYRGFRSLGDEVVVLADAAVAPDIRDSLAAVPILPPSIWHRAGDGAGRATRYARVLIHPWQTWRIMRRYLKANQQFDAIFVPTVGLYHLLAWIWLIKRTLRNRPTRVLLFFIHLPAGWDSQSGRPVPDGSPTSWLLFRLLRWLHREIKSGKVVLGAETELTRSAVKSFSGVPVTVFPQIVIPLPASESGKVPSRDGIEMGCYGPSRAEKGSDVLQEAIAIYRRRFPASRARFTLHWTQDFAGKEGRVITQSPELLRDSRVQYVTRYFDHAEYEEQIRRTHVMLLPYRLSSYRLRGSRVVMEAVVNGIPVVATRGTALAEVVEAFGSGLYCEDGDPENLARAIREMEERYDELSRAAKERAPAAAMEFSVGSFRRVFLGAGLAEQPTTPGLRDLGPTLVTAPRPAAESNGARAPITAIVTAYKRIGQTLETLNKIRGCQPGPDEIMVHVDGNQTACADAIRGAFPDIKILVSCESVGPGGARNKLIAGAKNEIVASFDDDSFPMDADYFGRVLALFEKFPGASILSATIYQPGEPIRPANATAHWVADFIGCGCVYRRSAFLRTSGYVPLPVAYGMEEVDLALGLLANEQRILSTPWLRVFHDTRLQHHRDPEIVAASIANLALLAYLRYPKSLWPLGAAQCLNRVRWLVTHGRFKGILRGIGMIPSHLWSKRHLRHPLGGDTVRSFVRLRRQPVQCESPA
jgi:glycosyltransferase involved in cell wall biosynthesis